jgi:phosphohistidine phosphatase SixA
MLGSSNAFRRNLFTFSAALMLLAASGASGAEMLTGQALVDALRQGGYVLVMRHASSPFAKPDKDTAEPENTGLERQLDQTGRDTATAMGKALKSLDIPVGDVLSSPAYRALETVRLAGLGQPTTLTELSEGDDGMKAKIGDDRAAWLRSQAADVPQGKTNTLVVTHTPNIMASFGAQASGIKSGEALVFHPDGNGHADLIARIGIETWPTLSAR